jgi:hypothetical protein
MKFAILLHSSDTRENAVELYIKAIYELLKDPRSNILIEFATGTQQISQADSV